MRTSRALLLALALVATMTVGGPVPGAVPAAAAAEADRTLSISDLRLGIVSRTNAVRRRHDRPVLRRSACLMANAQRHALRLAARGTLVHQDLSVLFRQCDASGRVGENVLYTTEASPREMVRLWMRSPGHRANILDRRFRRIGVGVAYDVLSGRYYAVQVFATRIG